MRSTPRHDPEPNGWTVFASIVLLIAAIFSVLYGLVAILDDDVVTVGGGGGVIVWNFTVWGWVHVVVGAAMGATAYGLLVLKNWARVVAIILAGLNAIAQIALITAFPLWAILVIALDIVVIYQLTVNWARD